MMGMMSCWGDGAAGPCGKERAVVTVLRWGMSHVLSNDEFDY